MPNYEKNLAIAFTMLTLATAGYGFGKYQNHKSATPQSNYSQKTEEKQSPKAEEHPEKLDKPTEAPSTTNCKIKGNISAAGNKIYHLPSGSFYARVKAEMCFNSEADAVAAGFRKSAR